MTITIETLDKEISRLRDECEAMARKEDAKGRLARRMYIIRGCHIAARKFQDLQAWINDEQEKDEVELLISKKDNNNAKSDA